ncbi:MAG: outer membrane lipoprotein chaperone LolA [Gammaproteobacteria bacterium]|nr:outer membrane lipoprotein chaperone LolA [Gammaproteobacteria bacterium]
MLKYSLLFIITFYSAVSFAQINKTLDQFYQSTQSLEAVFEQVITNTRGNVIEKSSGNLTLSRPDKFILEYIQPSEQKYISNGKTIWIYDIELEQVSIKNIDEGVGDSPALLLSSNTNIYKHYDVSDIKVGKSDGLIWIQLLAKEPEMTFERVLLAFKGTNLMQMTMHDSFGQTTNLKFSEIQINKPFANRQFNFVPPEDVDIIGTVTGQ